MAKLQLDPKKIAAVKEVASGKIGQKLAEKAQQLKGGVQLSAYDRAAGKKLLTGLTTDKAASAAAGSPMGGKAVAAQGRGGQTMGQKAVKAQGKGSPVVKAIKETLTGKSTAPIAKTEELKMSTYQLPSAVQIGPHSYNYEQTMDALKKVRKTYGEGSDEYKALADAVGYISEKANYGMIYKKPDLRKDAGKSYVDTAQAVYQNVRDRIPTLGRNENIAVGLLNQFGVKGARSLAKDKDAVEGQRNK